MNHYLKLLARVGGIPEEILEMIKDIYTNAEVEVKNDRGNRTY